MTVRQMIGRIPGARVAYNAVTRARRAPLIGYDDRPANRHVRLDLARLARHNLLSRRSILGHSTAVVTMTTHGARIRRVHLAIESIARGSVGPHRMILWLDDARLATALPRPLRRLVKRGLEVRVVPSGMRVHTKYYFYVRSIASHSRPMVTADDDIIYPAHWLADLETVASRYPGAIVCHRAHRVELTQSAIASYLTWGPCTSGVPSFRHFGTSVSGQYFAPEFLNTVREAATGFIESAPDNDDIWLHSLAVRHAVRVVQVTEASAHFPFIPGSQSSGLYFTNAMGGRNDEQVAACYSPADVRRLRADA